MIELRDGSEAQDPRLGRIPEFDDRSRNFPVRRLLGGLAPVRKTWRLDTRLNQRDTPRCVPHAWAHDDAAAPKRRKPLTWDQIGEWYATAQANDEWAGSNYDGTSTLGGAKAGVILKKFDAYLWCFTLEDVILTVGHLGPVITGTNWYRGMFEPNEKGFLVPTGPIDGGHEWMLRGVDPVKEYFLMTNSWDRTWGKNGDAKISFTDYDHLRREDGDAAYPVR